MFIKMKALRSFGYAGVNEGPISRGHEFSVRDEHRARDLESQDPALAYRIEAKLPPKPNPEIARAMVENKASCDGPLPLAGGRTGADEPQPSSPPAPQPRRRRSRHSADDLLS